jgi:hypothetical protein
MFDRTMTFYHVSHGDNWYSIVEHGLDTKRSTGRKPAIWLVTPSRLSWAISHVCRLKGYTPNDLVVFTVTVRRSWLQKTKMRGVWCCMVDIQPDRIIDYFPTGLLRLDGDK